MGKLEEERHRIGALVGVALRLGRGVYGVLVGALVWWEQGVNGVRERFCDGDWKYRTCGPERLCGGSGSVLGAGGTGRAGQSVCVVGAVLCWGLEVQGVRARALVWWERFCDGDLKYKAYGPERLCVGGWGLGVQGVRAGSCVVHWCEVWDLSCGISTVG
ncbi:hypothetical protein PoB_004452400 [Plakobranchus ocellatus]|uniref:Uncharacterized protein n=1 Tax=Plakobranchus ocellatus TaxID=259542 RepID=A0AAV4BD20_9GAST|nr:hypothetical protein PoB_004452400 [Plakobranchus ocellatus]